MDIRHPLAVVTVAAVVAATGQAFLRAQSGPAASYAPPKTPWGDPDLQGVWPGTASLGIPMQRARELGTRAVLTEQEYEARSRQLQKQLETDNAEFEIETADISNAGEVGSATSPPPHWLERGKPSRQASLVVAPADGRTPALTAEAQARAKAAQEARRARGPADSWEDRSYWDRCVTRGPIGSVLPTVYNAGNEIVQAPGYVVIRNEMIHEARIVPIDGRPHLPGGVRSYMGHSRGRWDGNTLVVETRNVHRRAGIGGAAGGGAPQTDAVVLTERFTLIDADTLQYSVTIVDPGTWVEPWTIAFPWRRDSSYRLFEYACHEGNYAMRNILSGAREDDKRK
jgi:hypothetical protein